jgi:exopolyphosphatase/guanosine-5'-triphosphate,3'-diphosphate pyrophosphatase
MALDWGGRANHPCIGVERADLVLAGCAILEAICRLYPVGRLRVADRGLREGILLGLMQAVEGERRAAAQA